MPQHEGPTFSIAVFPFLKTSAPSKIGSLIFRPTDDLANLSDEQAKAVTEIAGMLFLQNDLRLKSASYAITPPVDLTHAYVDTPRLVDIQAVTAYLYAEPHARFGTPFLSTEHASLAVFTPTAVPASLAHPEHDNLTIGEQPSIEKDFRGEVSGYTGFYNFRHYFWATRYSRLYGPQPHMTLNFAQDLSLDLERARSASRAYRLLLGRLLVDPVSSNNERILTALRWFNESNREGHDDNASLVCLAIAFESLLGLPASEKTDRLVDAIALLLGRVPRVDVWATQFYKARSTIVHEGHASNLRFVAADSPKAKNGQVYQSLLSYGMRIFRLCLSTLLVGSEMAHKAGLEDLLITNEERFRSLSRLLGGSSFGGEEQWERASVLCDSIETHKFLNEEGLQLKTIVDAVRLAIQAWLREHPSVAREVRTACSKAVSDMKGADVFDQLEAIRQMEDSFPRGGEDAERGTRVVNTLIGTAWHYLFTHYYWLKQTREAERAAGKGDT